MPLKVSMIIGNTPDAARLGQAIQAQVKDGGFDLQLQPTEFAASLDQTDAGKYQMFQIGWSGRVDPDGNIANFVSSLGSQNNNGYSNSTVDALLAQARAEADVAARRDLYGQVITQLHQDVPHHLPLPAEELHRRRPHRRGRAGVRRRPAALRHGRLRRLTGPPGRGRSSPPIGAASPDRSGRRSRWAGTSCAGWPSRWSPSSW